MNLDLDLYNWMLVFLRISAFLLVLPFFSMVNFPVMMRIALAAITSLLLAPTLPAFPVGNLPIFSLLGVMFQEVSIGLLLGFMARMIFFAVDLGGNIIATEMGLQMGSIFNPLTQSSSQVPATILFYLAAVVMLTLNLHHWMLLGFERTYLVLPMGGAHLSTGLFEAVIKNTNQIFIVALQISAPIIAVSFVVSVVFAVLSRAVPQMNVFSESFSFRIVGGLIVFGFTLQLTAQHVVNYLNRLPDDLLRVAQLVGG
ncbi:MAG TPA: flagellar biosynthetic protein FliR [Verrucomicrobiae bacterium]|jgi:flagellar biosynthetic protein FliR|nr:flagellar biosynthetic protein FliR [Verrucomicrobiae bacterium]